MKPRAVSAEVRGGGGGGGGAFMRIEVVSMLKLTALCAGAALVVLLFTIVGYGGAPAAAQTDFTSSVSRCTSEFSRDLFRACAADENVASLSQEAMDTMGGNSTDVVDALLRLSKSDQVDVLGCMLDKCATTTTRPLSVDDPPTELLVAHYAFGINGITQKNRYFYLSVAFPNSDMTQDTSFAVTMMPHVRGYYRAEADSGNLSHVDLLPDHRSLSLTVECEKDAVFCEAQYFLRFTEIDYVQYRIDVVFNASAAYPLPINGRDPQFRKTWGTAAFTDWMLGVKYFFLVASGLLAGWYNRNLNRLAAHEQTMEQNWVLALGVALVLFNDPFYWVEATTGGHAVQVLSVLFQTTFFQMLLLFWLIALDNLRLQGRESGVSNATFFVPKVAFTAFFWLMMALYYGYIKYYTNNDPTWDPLAANHNFALLRALVVLCSLVYLGWFLTLSVMSRDEVRAKRPRYRYLLAMSLWMVLTCFLGLGAGSFSPMPASGGAWTAYYALLNMYVFMLEFLFAPSASALRAAQKRNDAHGKDDDPEARPALAPPSTAFTSASAVAHNKDEQNDDDDVDGAVETRGVELDLA